MYWYAGAQVLYAPELTIVPFLSRPQRHSLELPGMPGWVAGWQAKEGEPASRTGRGVVCEIRTVVSTISCYPPNIYYSPYLDKYLQRGTITWTNLTGICTGLGQSTLYR